MESGVNMKFIDIENWKRKNHYNYFKQLDYPHFNICGNLDITNFYRYIKKINYHFLHRFYMLLQKQPMI